MTASVRIESTCKLNCPVPDTLILWTVPVQALALTLLESQTCYSAWITQIMMMPSFSYPRLFFIKVWNYLILVEVFPMLTLMHCMVILLRLIRVVFKSKTISLWQWQSAFALFEAIGELQRKTLHQSHAAVFSWNPRTRGQFLQAKSWVPSSLLRHCPHRLGSVTGTFYKGEVGIPCGGWCNGADFTEISKFPEILGELSMHKQCGLFFALAGSCKCCFSKRLMILAATYWNNKT